MSTDKHEVSEISTMIEISRRTSYMIRYVLIAIIILCVGVALLNWSYKNDMRKMSEYMSSMAEDISVMSNSIVKMQTSMSSIGSGINKVAIHTQSISGSISQTDSPVETLLLIADTIKLMQTDAHGLGGSMENVNHNLSTINKQMKSLNKKLGYMVQDANRMPSPTRMFPF